MPLSSHHVISGDLVLWTRSRNGDRNAFQALYQKYAKSVIASLRRSFKNEIAEEAMQEAFLRELEYDEMPQPPGYFLGYMCAVSRSIANRLTFKSRREAGAASLSEEQQRVFEAVAICAEKAHLEALRPKSVSDLMWVAHDAFPFLAQKERLHLALSYAGYTPGEICRVWFAQTGDIVLSRFS